MSGALKRHSRKKRLSSPDAIREPVLPHRIGMRSFGTQLGIDGPAIRPVTQPLDDPDQEKKSEKYGKETNGLPRRRHFVTPPIGQTTAIAHGILSCVACQGNPILRIFNGNPNLLAGIWIGGIVVPAEHFEMFPTVENMVRIRQPLTKDILHDLWR